MNENAGVPDGVGDGIPGGLKVGNSVPASVRVGDGVGDGSGLAASEGRSASTVPGTTPGRAANPKARRSGGWVSDHGVGVRDGDGDGAVDRAAAVGVADGPGRAVAHCEIILLQAARDDVVQASVTSSSAPQFVQIVYKAEHPGLAGGIVPVGLVKNPFAAPAKSTSRR